MMRRMKVLSMVCLMILASYSAYAYGSEDAETVVLGKEMMHKDTTKQRRLKNHLIAPKGEWQCGLSVMYADFSSADTEFMLMLQGLNASASMLRLAPEAAYTFKDNHAIGAKFQYTNMNGMIDSATADLLGNLSLTVGNISASSRSMTASVFQRTYVGLDNRGRVGVFWDYILGVTRSQTQFAAGEPSDAYTVNKKIHLGFAPGIVYFPMNNVSVQASISLADLAYCNVSAYQDGEIVGTRDTFKALASLNLLGLSFGVTVHF